MVALLLVLLLILVLFGAGFALHLLWWVALVALVLWVVGFFVRGPSGSRWYRW
ncbi:hydrophobic protein [Kitasatospora sp. KL5]|uniref:hydrophobic protein n=1 Tax=Kitasatospora sp. KL5 TaxID=3425125 RepID=UPI003D6DFFFA